MLAIQLQTEIEAAPEIVFDLLADHTKHPLWDPHMMEATLHTERPIGRGSTGVTVGKFMGRRVENEVSYGEYDRPRYVSGGTTSGTLGAKNSVTFTPTATGTRIDFRLEVRLRSLMRLIEPLMKSSLIEQKTETLEALRDYVRDHPAPHGRDDPRDQD